MKRFPPFHIILSFLLAISADIFSCASQQPPIQVKRTEVIETATQFYDTTGSQFSKPFMVMKEKTWYKDSMAIEEVKSHLVVVDTAGKETESLVLLNYRFNDLRNGYIYEYGSFSDTAVLLRKYVYSDTMKITGGWNFNYKRSIRYNGEPVPITDTVIRNITYKRLKLSTGKGLSAGTTYCYFRCDKKRTLFQQGIKLSDMIGCPLVINYRFSDVEKGPAHSVEISFLSDTLTAFESQVFTAREKYAKQHPVK